MPSDGLPSEGWPGEGLRYFLHCDHLLQKKKSPDFVKNQVTVLPLFNWENDKNLFGSIPK